MNLSQTIKQTQDNIRYIREYIDNLEYNNTEKAGELSCFNRLTLDDIDNDTAFIRDYNGLTNSIVKLLKEYYGDR